VEVRVESNGLRLPNDAFAGFWAAAVHAVRNAVDHGLETKEERVASGKEAPPTLTFSAELQDDSLVIAMCDDGRGIDWTKIAAKAKEAGLPCTTQDDLVEALFSDGVSTAADVTDVSGRGVGMAALREACVSLGGRIAVESERGLGTEMSFRFPASVVHASTVRDIAAHPSLWPVASASARAA
jgi:two-component system chemotaxis sensor kinase CheA